MNAQNKLRHKFNRLENLNTELDNLGIVMVTILITSPFLFLVLYNNDLITLLVLSKIVIVGVFVYLLSKTIKCLKSIKKLETLIEEELYN